MTFEVPAKIQLALRLLRLKPASLVLTSPKLSALRNIALSVIFSLSVHVAFGQEVFATASASQKTAGGSLTWTIGETIITTFSADITLTQGFNQPIVIFRGPESNEYINVQGYPNPFSANLIIDRGELPDKIAYKIMEACFLINRYGCE